MLVLKQFSTVLSKPMGIYFLISIGCGSLLFALMGYARRYLNFTNAFLKYTNEAVYPFFILHQTITVALAFYIVLLEMNMWIKFFLTSFGTGVITLAIYHCLIKPYNVVRPLFGMNKRVQGERQSIKINKVDGYARS